MKKKVLLFPWLLVLFLLSCSVTAPTVRSYSSIDGYKYVYITPTSDKTSVSGTTVGTRYGVYGSTESTSTSPADLISGHFIKRGYIRQPEINPDFVLQTIIVNYGETNREKDAFGYRIEATIQIISAKTNELICVGTAEGYAEKEADALRNAVNSCMDAIFTWHENNK